MDEAALTGMTLTAPPPKLERSVAACQAAADELSELGSQAHADPEPLHVKEIRRQRFGTLAYERLTFEHEPLLPRSLAAAGLAGPATAAVHLCRRGDEQRPWLVWVHGAGQGQPLDLLFSRARRIENELGVNIALPVQPGHGVRRNAWPAYPNMDPLANVAGMMRAASEVRAVVRWLRPQSTAIAVSGVSMGSPVAALVSHLEAEKLNKLPTETDEDGRITNKKAAAHFDHAQRIAEGRLLAVHANTWQFNELIEQQRDAFHDHGFGPARDAHEWLEQHGIVEHVKDGATEAGRNVFTSQGTRDGSIEYEYEEQREREGGGETPDGSFVEEGATEPR